MSLSAWVTALASLLALATAAMLALAVLSHQEFGSLVSLAAGDFVYIRNEGDGSEELFDERDDPRELLNRAHVDFMQPLVRQFRALLDQIKAGSSHAAQ